ncbi:hypothetical protein DFP94_109158 [Fontibacillus phaseoli]|uniref:Uncharacterized protein n=1 Tax=Fontibacillus phaseoli TaxID=1416533 RepID=A0A369B7E1_9BACL|nr:hypothetical protein [Fontibacillus phaseoli]RCX17433.1 hypothetical protein DFP94_109158 [Fontibacillus phaseoli]
MNHMQMKPLSGKEVNYIADSVANEDMLIKMCAAAAAVSTNSQLGQAITEHMLVHEHHMHTLIDALKQHQQLAPTQAQ